MAQELLIKRPGNRKLEPLNGCVVASVSKADALLIAESLLGEIRRPTNLVGEACRIRFGTAELVLEVSHSTE